MIDNSDPINDLMVKFYANRSSSTCVSYRNDLDTFRNYLGESSVHDVVRRLIQTPHSQANLTVLYYKVTLLEQKISSSTINRRLSAIRSLLKIAQQMNLIHWQLDIMNEKVIPYNKMRIIDAQDFKKLLKKASAQTHRKKAARDCAIIRLIHDLALKRNSITRLDFSDLDTIKKKLTVSLPSDANKTIKSFSKVTLQALTHWIKYRGEFEGPLFINFDHANKGKRLTGTSIYRIIRKLSEECGLATGPEEIRNGVISEVITKVEKIEISVEEIKAFSDHKITKNILDFKKKKEKAQKRLSKIIVE